jgi:SAM-dependent methyltransferase
VYGVEREDDAVAAARDIVAESGLTNIELVQADAAETGLPPDSVDVAMARHVLAHNGGDEQRIVGHLASLVRTGGAVYLVDVDLAGTRITGADPDLDDLTDRYVAFHRARGNDPLVGLRLSSLLEGAHLDVVSYIGFYNIVMAQPGMRSPAWAARAAMVAEGTITQADVDRWAAAFERTDAAAQRPTIFAPVFVAVGRKN